MSISFLLPNHVVKFPQKDMPQEDYIKRAKPKPKSRKKSPARKPAKKTTPTTQNKNKLIIIGVLIVLLSAFIAFLWGIDGSAETPADETEAAQTAIKPVKKTPTTKNSIPPKPEKEKWEYVNELKNKTVTVDVKQLDKKGPFVMQCGSFRRKDQADALKAKIAFTGFEADVKRSTGKNGVWYRVVIDKFDTKREAESARHRLKKSSVNGCRIWASQ